MQLTATFRSLLQVFRGAFTAPTFENRKRCQEIGKGARNRKRCQESEKVPGTFSVCEGLGIIGGVRGA
jgi:hypothetical protein